MTPYFFKSKNQLFAVYHEAEGGLKKGKGVLLCYPLWHEYMRAHWTFRQLAEALSRDGFDVLRFDYTGTGDSELSEDLVSLQDLVVDTEDATEELRNIAGIEEISVVGMRFGATLAALTKRHKLEKLILWDPVISGTEMIKNLFKMHDEKMSIRELRGGPKKSTSKEGEMLGYIIPNNLKEQISDIDLNKLSTTNAKKTIVLLSEGELVYKNANSIIQTEPKCLWNETIHTEQTILAPKTVQQIVYLLNHV